MTHGTGVSYPSETNLVSQAERGVDLLRMGGAAVCLFLSLLLIWSVQVFPAVDFPQHVAQISTWVHLDDPEWGFREQFQLNWWTPYLAGYIIARIFACVLSPLMACKMVLTLSMIAFVWCFGRILHERNIDWIWCLCGFPAFFGYAFHWGFLNFLVATPVALWFLREVLLLQRHCSRGHAGRVAFWSIVLFAAHGLTWLVFSMIAFLTLWFSTWDWKRRACLCPPLLPGAIIAALWTMVTKREGTSEPVYWVLVSLRDIPERLFHAMGTPFGGTEETVFALSILLVLLLMMHWGGMAPRREFRAYFPLIILGAWTVMGPIYLFGTYNLCERFSLFLLPLLFLGLNQRSPTVPPWPRMGLLVVIIAGLLALLVRFHTFDDETAEFWKALEHIPMNSRVASVMINPASNAAPFYPYLHFEAYIQALKGGEITFSFAESFATLVRYKPGRARQEEGREWLPMMAFDAGRLGELSLDWSYYSRYEYFLLKAPIDLGKVVFSKAPFNTIRVGQWGEWCLYRKTIPETAAPSRR